MKSYLVYTILISVVLFASCQKTNSYKNQKDASITENIESFDPILAKGFSLLESNCFTCHSPKGEVNNRIAPPMFAVKRHYIDAGYNKSEFIEAVTDYVQNPSEEKALMPGAINKFGVMPKMNFSKEDLEAIANYLYETELEKPEWFEKHYQKEKAKYQIKKEEDTLSYRDKGLKIAMATKSVLGKNLLGAIQTKGTEGALSFCNEKAYPLTDSMAQNLKAYIKRVSDNNRNSDNDANSAELEYIIEAKKTLANGQEIKPKVAEINHKIIGYYPIITNKMCLQCHGKSGIDIQPKVLAKINKLYPNDKAIGYGENQLRGIWVIEMEK